MDPSACVACRQPVLELEGQFDKLDSYFVTDGVPPPESAGWWHLACLRASDVGPGWQAARLRNYRDVRRYAVVSESAGWVVLRDAHGGRIAIGATGELVDLSVVRQRVVRKSDEGVVFSKLEESFHLHRSTKLAPFVDHPLSALLEALGIAERVVDAIALERATVRFDRSGAVARIEYGVFVPRVLLQ